MIVADEALRIDVVLEVSPVAVARRATPKLDQRLDELSERRIEVIAISAEPRERFEQLQADWKLERLPSAYGLADPSMREWACSSRGAGATTNRRFSTSH